MNVYFTADLHLGHDNVRGYCKRPFSTIEEMDEAIIENWNKTIKHKAEVHVLGDFAWGNSDKVAAYIKRLKGKIVFIRGNHDSGLLQWAKKEGIFIPDTRSIKVCGESLFLSHYAHRVWDRSHYGTIHLFGHSHGGLADHGLSMDVGVDCNNFAPVQAEFIIEKMRPIRERLIQEGKIFASRR